MSTPSSPSVLSAPLACLALFIVWSAANALCATDAHKLLYNTSFPHLFVDLTLLQTLLGVIVTAPFLPKPYQRLRQLFSYPTSTSDVYIAASHFFGCILSNASFGLIGATSTLVWKLCEPFATVVLKWHLLRERVSLLRLCGVFIVVLGVLTFSNFSLAQPIIFSPIILANIALPLRNVLIKAELRRKSQSEGPSPQQTYFNMQGTALPMCLFVAAVKSFMFATPVHMLPLMLRNAAYFNVYQVASIALLSRLDALSHALANILKRFSGICVSAVIVGTHLTGRHWLGLLLTTVGFPMYLLGDLQADVRPGLFKRHSNLLRSIAMFLILIVTFVIGFSVHDIVDSVEPFKLALTPVSKERPLMMQLSDDVQRDDSDLASIPRLPGKIVVRIKVGYIARNFSYTNYDDAVLDDGDNMGNLVWQYAAYKAIPDFSKSTVCYGTRNDCVERHPEICNMTLRDCIARTPDATKRTTLLLYLPTANVFASNGKTFGSVVFHMQKYGDWALPIGIGIQTYFGQNGTMQDISPGRRIETEPEDHTFTPNALDFIRLHERRKMPMLMRGDFTWRAAKAAGFNFGISQGCPSLMLHPDVQLGQMLERKYEALKERIGDRSLKIAINIMTLIPGYFKFFRSILESYPNSYIYAQGRYDMVALKKFGVPFNRVRFFLNVEDWRESISQMDLSFGARIHGNMIALGSGVPVFVIAPDHRVLELVERMQIPHTTGMDERLVAGLDVAQLVATYQFDGKAFDLNRCRAANVYARVYSRYGIEVSQQVKRIAQSCSLQG